MSFSFNLVFLSISDKGRSFNAEDGSTIHTTLTSTRQSGAERPTLVSRKHAPTNFTVNHQ